MAEITYYKQDKEFFFEPSRILFYEADGPIVYAHTAHHIYRVRYRIYELEAILPDYFLRVSKSAIVNVNQILSFATTVGTTGTVEFIHSPKRLHISRKYIKVLRSALKSRSTKKWKNQINLINIESTTITANPPDHYPPSPASLAG